MEYIKSLEKTPGSAQATAELEVEGVDAKRSPSPVEEKTAEEVPQDDQESERSSITIANYPWKLKGPALLLVLCFTIGSNWQSAAFPPLKSTLLKKLEINNAQYGVISSANNLVNTVWPILSGIFIDYMGADLASVISTLFILLGSLTTALGASTANYGAFVGGQVISGFGSTTIETCQSKLYTHYYYGNNMGLVFGIDIAFGRVINTISKATAIPISENTGNWAWALWVGFLMSAFTFICNLGYIFFSWKFVPAESRPATGRAMEKKLTLKNGAGDSKFKFKPSTVFQISGGFWIMAITQLFQAGAVSVFTSNLSDMVSVTRGSTAQTAGYTSAIGQIMPIFLTPVVGWCFDRFGYRTHWVSGTAAIYILAFSLLEFTPQVNAMVPTILSSLALCSNALTYIGCVPLLTKNQNHIGLAFGLWKTMQNVGTVVMDVSSGAIQDLTPSGKHKYHNTMYFLIALKSMEVFYGFIYWVGDKKYLGGVLSMSEKQKIAHLEAEIADPSLASKSPLLKVIKPLTIFGAIASVSVFIVAWVLFFLYSLN